MGIVVPGQRRKHKILRLRSGRETQDPSTSASPAPAPPSATPALGGVPGDARVPPSLRMTTMGTGNTPSSWPGSKIKQKISSRPLWRKVGYRVIGSSGHRVIGRSEQPKKQQSALGNQHSAKATFGFEPEGRHSCSPSAYSQGKGGYPDLV